MTHQAVGLRVGKLDHVQRQHLGHAADAGGYAEAAAAGGFQDGDAEGLCKGAVEEDVAADQDVPHILVRHRSQQLHAIMQPAVLTATAIQGGQGEK